MPIPIIVICVVAGVAAAAAVTVTAYNWDRIVILMTGKSLAIFGESGTGKTTLHKFLRAGTIPATHEGTTRENVNQNRYQLGDLNLDLKRGTDIGGLETFVAEWKEIYLSANYVLYLFNSAKVLGNDSQYIAKVVRHLTHIRNWSEEVKSPPKTYLIGTFSDKTTEYEVYRRGNYQEFEDKLRCSLQEAVLKGDVKASAVIVGSLADQNQAEHLVGRLLRQIQES